MTSCLHERVEANSSIPAWFEEGVYARYKLSRASEITFVNESFYWFKSVNAFFRWEVVDFDGHEALLEVSFTFEQETTIEYPATSAGESLKLNLTTSVYVDVENRDIWSLEDEFLGKTGFWLPPHPEVGDKFNYLNGTVIDIGYTTDTPQGSQKKFTVEVKFKGSPRWFSYDLNTGLLLHGYPKEGREAMLHALGISEVDRSFELEATNIDLGPPSFKFFIMTTLLKIAPVVFIIVAVTIYYWKKRRA